MRSLLLVSAVLVAAGGCGQPGEAPGTDAAPMPTTVGCADASQMEERAIDARRRSAELKGDRAKIIDGTRARFVASLAAIAQLKCRTEAAEVDSLLGKALEVSRVAETTNSEYEAAIRWTEADLIAADAIALLISRLPAPPSR